MKTFFKSRVVAPMMALIPIAHAQPTAPPAPPIQPRTSFTASDLIVLLNRLAGWFLAVISVIAVIMILVGAFQYITAGGNEEKTEAGRKYIIYGLIGVAVAILAWAIVSFVGSLLV